MKNVRDIYLTDDALEFDFAVILPAPEGGFLAADDEQLKPLGAFLRTYGNPDKFTLHYASPELAEVARRARRVRNKPRPSNT